MKAFPTNARRLRRAAGEWSLAWLLISPAAALFAAFAFYPLGKAMYLSLYETSPFGGKDIYVGLDQWQRVMQDDAFRKSLWVTGKFVLLTVPAGMVLGLALALLSNQRLMGITIFRTIFSSTIASSVAIAAVTWALVLNPQNGILNYVLKELGFRPISWLTDPQWALFAVALTTVWISIGFTTIVILAALQGLPRELYESAQVDGAGRIRTFASITLPLLSPALFFVGVVSTISALQTFGQIDVLTRGGPLGETRVAVYAIYEDAFRHQDVGTACVESIVLFAVIASLTILQFRAVGRRVFYQ
jgi:sn-glycerol 3-phosphate transport system permease protein